MAHPIGGPGVPVGLPAHPLPPAVPGMQVVVVAPPVPGVQVAVPGVRVAVVAPPPPPPVGAHPWMFEKSGSGKGGC